MITEEFNKLYKNLNPEQKKAVDEVEGAVMVVAGPGTGKTTVLTLRIAKILLETQINPENVLALTFTEAAAAEMRKRLLSIIGQDAYRVEITTFHSFCNNFIKKHQEEFSGIISSDNINEIEQIRILESILKKLDLEILKPLGNLAYYLKPLSSVIDQLKRENITPELFSEALTDFEQELNGRDDLYHQKGPHKGKMKSQYQKQLKDIEKNKELVIVYKEYQKRLTSERKYDYNDMLLEVIKKLETHEYLLQYLQERFHYILVDEHQDTNSAQNRIVELLASHFENPNLFVVGDEKQAIFRFQGATLENFLYFKNRYPEAKLINLSANYRSTQTILDATFSVISHNPQSTKILSEGAKLIKQTVHPEEKISVVELSASDIEYFWITEKIKELLPSTPGHEIAVLSRNNRDLDMMVSSLENEKIPFVIQSDSNILDDIAVSKLILLFRAINNPSNLYVKRVLLFDIFSLHPLDVFKIERTAYDRKVDVWDILTTPEKLEIKSKKEIGKFISLFTDPEKGFITKAGNKRFDEVFVDVLNDSGLLASILKKRNAQETLTKIRRLFDEVKDQVGKNPSFQIGDFLEYINLLEEHELSLKQTMNIYPEGSVRLMTVHKAKGLEFDVVFVINAYDGHWGNQKKKSEAFSIPWENLKVRLKKDIEDEQNSDERRLFYVALTRARKQVYLTYACRSLDGKEQIPSQFIAEIPEEFKTKEDVTDFEDTIQKHQEVLFKTTEKKMTDDEIAFSKEFVTETFHKNGLSVSALNNYIECPWKFFFMNLLRIPEKIDDAGLFGNAVHSALNQYIIALKKKKASKDLLLQKFEEELKLQSITESEFERFRQRGIEALDGYYGQGMEEWPETIESEVEIKGVRISDDIFLNGVIDMIYPQKDGKFVDVYDFKTGKPKSRNEIEGNTQNGDGNYKRQLVFYKILLDRYRSGFYQMKNGIIEFIEPAENGKFRREIFEITKSETDELLKQITQIGNEIITLSFWNSTCGEKDCEYCRLRSYM